MKFYGKVENLLNRRYFEAALPRPAFGPSEACNSDSSQRTDGRGRGGAAMTGRGRLLAAASAAAAAALVFWVGDGGGVFRFSGAPDGQGGPAPSGAGFPRTFTDFHGFALTLPQTPARIASQSLPTDHLLLPSFPPNA